MIKQLKFCQKWLYSFAANGCEIVAPSDMMDGRIKIIRETFRKRKI